MKQINSKISVLRRIVSIRWVTDKMMGNCNFNLTFFVESIEMWRQYLKPSPSFHQTKDGFLWIVTYHIISSCICQAYAILWFFVIFVLSLFTSGSRILLACVGEPDVKRERTTNNEKSWNGIGLGGPSFIDIYTGFILTAAT